VEGPPVRESLIGLQLVKLLAGNLFLMKRKRRRLIGRGGVHVLPRQLGEKRRGCLKYLCAIRPTVFVLKGPFSRDVLPLFFPFNFFFSWALCFTSSIVFDFVFNEVFKFECDTVESKHFLLVTLIF
jgi:hypothetical protein